jgi:hypothetical protein
MGYMKELVIGQMNADRQLEVWGLVHSKVDPLADAIAWREKNPAAWDAIVKWASDDMDAHIHPSMDAYGHALRRPHWAHKLGLKRILGDPVLFNDHLTTSLARLIMRDHPTIKFPIRKARVDSWS